MVAGSNLNETIDTVSRDSHQLPASNEEAKKKRKRRKKSTDDGADTKPSPLTVDRPVPLAVIKHNKITEKNSKKKKEGKKKEGGKSNGEKDKARRLGLYK